MIRYWLPYVAVAFLLVLAVAALASADGNCSDKRCPAGTEAIWVRGVWKYEYKCICAAVPQ